MRCMKRSPEDRLGALRENSAQGWQPDDDVDDIADLLPKSRPLPRRMVIVSLMIIVLIALCVFGFLRTRGTSQPEAAQITAQPTEKASVQVHVAGAVKKPGVVTLDGQARVVDALDAAGGTKKNADLTQVNLARVVKDGEQIVVPEIADDAGANAPQTAQGTAGGGTGSAAGGTAAGAGQKININSASAAELENLPGIGPVTAAAIVAYREEKGPFASVDALTEVSGIGEATLEKIKPNAAV